MEHGSAGIAGIERVGTRPALMLPARLVKGQPGHMGQPARGSQSTGVGGAGDAASQRAPQGLVPGQDDFAGHGGETGLVGGVEVPGLAGLINISDLAIPGYGPAVSLVECVELVGRLEAGVVDGPQARLIAVLCGRIAAHTSAQVSVAATRAVEVMAQEGAAKAGAGPAAHGNKEWERQVRAAVSAVALDLACTTGQVRAAVRAAALMDDVPIVAAAAFQGQLGADKVGLLSSVWAGVPLRMRTEAVAGKLVQVAMDSPVPRAKREYRSMLALMNEASETATLEARVRQYASVHVTDLGGGLAELHVVDRAENIQAIATLVEAAARTMRHVGIDGPLGVLRAEVLANIAKQGLREQQVPTAFGTPLQLEGYGRGPVRMQMLQTPIRRLLPPSPGMPTVQWRLRAAGLLTPAQADALRDDPTWEGIVEPITLIDQKDPDYLAALEEVSTTHDGTMAQRRWAARRDGFQCRCPWCTDSSPPTDLHHTAPFSDTGITTVRNLIYVHAGCHDVLHHGWAVVMGPDGTATFTDPHGNTYTTEPQSIQH